MTIRLINLILKLKNETKHFAEDKSYFLLHLLTKEEILD